MPPTSRDRVDLLSAIAQKGVSECFFEEVGGHVGIAQPGSSMFVFGYKLGTVIGALAALKFRVYRVRPQVWQRALGLRRPKTMDLTRSPSLCMGASENLIYNNIIRRAMHSIPFCGFSGNVIAYNFSLTNLTTTTSSGIVSGSGKS